MNWINLLWGVRYTNAGIFIAKHPTARADVNTLAKNLLIKKMLRAPIWLLLLVPLAVVAFLRVVNVTVLWLAEYADHYMTRAFDYMAGLPYVLTAAYNVAEIEAVNARLDKLEEESRNG